MNYFIIYIISIVISLYWWTSIFLKQKNASWFFFLISTIAISLWLLLYFLFFSWITNTNTLTVLSRLAFGISTIWVYSFYFFLFYFQEKSKDFSYRKYNHIILVFFTILWFYAFTKNIVSNVQISPDTNIYREIYWNLLVLHFILNIIAILLILKVSIYQYPTLSYLNKVRFKWIALSWSLLILLLLILQLILPIFWIWILEKEIVFIFLFFVIGIVYILRRYYFSSRDYGITKWIIILWSFLISVSITEWLDLLIQYISDRAPVLNYWTWINQSPTFFVRFFICLTLYQLLYIFLGKKFLGFTKWIELHNRIQVLQKEISMITNMENLREKLKIRMNEIFKTPSCNLIIFEKTFSHKQLIKFFSISWNTIFINDFVFIEENTQFIDMTDIHLEISKNDFLILPIHSTSWQIIWLLKFGTKPLGDFYTKIEIDEIQSFAFFLEIHLKYIRTYSTIEELSKNLDKKVDEKTIEYNNIINRQKEFIWIISHEIRSPLWAAIFQSDSIMDDLDTKDIKPEKLKEELSILNKQLVRTWGLISKLFSVQYYDTHSVNLFRENIEFANFLEYEVELFSHVHSNITFRSKIDKKIGFVSIDKIQIQQVINNLMDNSVKFLNGNNPTISISAYKKWNNLYISIEDNGKWFEWIDIKDIFDKYSTGSHWTVWLWMGLYLCKKIISMHNGIIEASISDSLQGAKFSISIPIL